MRGKDSHGPQGQVGQPFWWAKGAGWGTGERQGWPGPDPVTGSDWLGEPGFAVLLMRLRSVRSEELGPAGVSGV